MTQRDRQDEAISAADAALYVKFGAVNFYENAEAQKFWADVYLKFYLNIGRI